MAKPGDPCQRQACAIQDCLKKNNYKEDKCQKIIQLMIDCCNTNGRELSIICKGMKSYNVVSAEKSSTNPENHK